MSMRTDRSQRVAQGTALDEVSQILLELEEFFDDRMDADCVGDPPEYVPNEEMKLSYRLKELRHFAGSALMSRADDTTLVDMMTTRDLAIELKRTPETVIRWRRLRIGPPFVRVQGRVLYKKSAVEEWLSNGGEIKQTESVVEPGRTKPMRSIAPFGLRLPPKLRAVLEASANENCRSLNSEILERLRSTVAEKHGIEQLAKDVRALIQAIKSAGK